MQGIHRRDTVSCVATAARCLQRHVHFVYAERVSLRDTLVVLILTRRRWRQSLPDNNSRFTGFRPSHK